MNQEDNSGGAIDAHFNKIYEDLSEATAALRAAALGSFRDRQTKTMEKLAAGDSMSASQTKLDFQEYMDIQNTLPGPYSDWRKTANVVREEKQRLDGGDSSEETTNAELLSVIIDQSHEIGAAAHILFNLARANVQRDPKPAADGNANAVFEAVELCGKLGDALKAVDAVMGNAVMHAEEYYKKLMENDELGKEALDKSVLRQHKLVLKHLPNVFEKAWTLKEDVMHKLAEVDNYRTANGEVDKDLWNHLIDTWSDREKQVLFHERNLVAAAKAVLEAN